MARATDHSATQRYPAGAGNPKTGQCENIQQQLAVRPRKSPRTDPRPQRRPPGPHIHTPDPYPWPRRTPFTVNTAVTEPPEPAMLFTEPNPPNTSPAVPTTHPSDTVTTQRARVNRPVSRRPTNQEQ